MLEEYSKFFKERRQKVITELLRLLESLQRFSHFDQNQLATLQRLYNDIDMFITLFGQVMTQEKRDKLMMIQNYIGRVIRAITTETIERLEQDLTFDTFKKFLAELTTIVPSKLNMPGKALSQIPGFEYGRSTKEHANTIADPLFFWACKAIAEEINAPYVFYGGTCAQLIAALCSNGDARSHLVRRCRLTDDIDFLIDPSFNSANLLKKLNKSEEFKNSYLEMRVEKSAEFAPLIRIDAIIADKTYSRIIKLNLNNDPAIAQSFTQKSFRDALNQKWIAQLHNGEITGEFKIMSPTFFMLSKTNRMADKDFYDLMVLNTSPLFRENISWSYLEKNTNKDLTIFVEKLRDALISTQ